MKGLYFNPILTGHPCRGGKASKKNYELGSRSSKRNPGGAVYIDCPHLAYFTSEELDPLLAELDEQNAPHSRARAGRKDPRSLIPRKQTRFPGQYGTCWYCGSHYVWGGNGITDHLMCARSREWKCWNSVGLNGPLFVSRLMSALLDRLTVLEGFDEQFRSLILESDRAGSIETELATLRRDEDALSREQRNILDAIAKYGPQEMFDERMKRVAQQTAAFKAERYRLERLGQRSLEVPECPAALRATLESAFQSLSTASPEFGILMREIVPELHVYLVRLCDGGHPLTRVRAQLDLSGICPDARLISGLQPMLTSTITLDVFEPPQRERIRKQAVALIADGCKQREACHRIAEQPKQPALQRALLLQQKMQNLGLTSPYILLKSPPEDYLKLRRHKAKHFRFEPLDGYVPPEIV